MPIRARLYIALILAAGMIGLSAELIHFHSADAVMFWCYFAFTLLTSGLKVRLPTVFATLSVNFLSILMGIVLFSLPEAILLGVAGTIVQCLWRPRVRPKVIQIAFQRLLHRARRRDCAQRISRTAQRHTGGSESTADWRRRECVLRRQHDSHRRCHRTHRA